MTKQQKTYLLLTATLIIWGLIGYQIFKQLNPKEEVASTMVTQKYQPKELKKVTSYIIKNDYRDPFLGKLPNNNAPVVKKKTKTKKKGKSKKRFPKVIYNGIVEGASQLFVLTINGTQESFQMNQTIKDVTLESGNEEEVSIRFNDEVKTFKIQ